jgi:LytR cell envelope-related transcriptional attenuator
VGRVRSWLAAPLGARLLGAASAAAGVALLVIGVMALNRGGGTPGAAPPPATVTSVPPASGTASVQPTTPTPSPTPGTTSAPGRSSPPVTIPSRPVPRTTVPAPPRAPLTVLNNSTIAGLGEQAADAARRRGWPVAEVGNFAGRLPETTVYYTPGDPAEQLAARQFATEFPQVQRVFPRYAGLPPTPPGIVLVVTRDWTG